jgi:hypothetical protein
MKHCERCGEQVYVMPDGATEIERLRARVAELEKALEITEAVCRAAQEENKALREILRRGWSVKSDYDMEEEPYYFVDEGEVLSKTGYLGSFESPDAAIDAAIEAVKGEKA